MKDDMKKGIGKNPRKKRMRKGGENQEGERGQMSKIIRIFLEIRIQKIYSVKGLSLLCH
jgi:hypothetical protein